MPNRAANITKYALQSQADFLTLLEQVMAASPELFCPADKAIAIGHISDMCSDLFAECIETANDADNERNVVLEQRNHGGQAHA